MNQNLSSPTEQPKITAALPHSVQKLEISRPLTQIKDGYLQDFRSQKIKTRLQNKRLAAVNSLSAQTQIIQEDAFGQGLSLQEFIAECQQRTYILEQLNELVDSINSASLYRQYLGVIGIRRLLAAESPPLQPLIDAGVILRLIEFLSREEEPKLQAEAAWALGNLSSGTRQQTQKVVEHGVIASLLPLLNSQHHDVRLGAICNLGNLAGDGADLRDEILQRGMITTLVKIMEQAIFEGDQLMIKHGNWALANLCSGRPLPPFKKVKEALPVFAKVIMSQEDSESQREAIGCMACFSEGGREDRIQGVIDTGVIPYILRHLDNADFPGQVGCIRTIGNICAGCDEQVDMLLEIAGVVEKLFNALKSPNKAARKEAAWAFSNIAGGTYDQIEHIVGNAEYLDQLLYMGMNDTKEIRKEVVILFSNLINCASREQLGVLFEKNIVEFFGKSIKEEGLQEVALEAIFNILTLGPGKTPEGFSKADCLSWLEENEMLSVLEDLQEHPNGRIAKFAARILGANDQRKSE